MLVKEMKQKCMRIDAYRWPHKIQSRSSVESESGSTEAEEEKMKSSLEK